MLDRPPADRNIHNSRTEGEKTEEDIIQTWKCLGHAQTFAKITMKLVTMSPVDCSEIILLSCETSFTYLMVSLLFFPGSSILELKSFQTSIYG